MEIDAALTQFIREANLTDTTLGAAVGVSAFSVKQWRTGVKSPRADRLLLMLRMYPSFAALLGLKAA